KCEEPISGWGRIAVAPGGKLAAVGRTQNGAAYIDLVDLPSSRRTPDVPVVGASIAGYLGSPGGPAPFLAASALIAGRTRTASWRVDAPTLGQLLFSPDGKSLYVCTSEEDVSKGSSLFGRIWALGTQGPASPLMAHTGTGAYSPSADRLVTATEHLFVVRDAT